MKTKRNLIPIWLLFAAALPAVVQAQSFTNNYGIWGYEDNSNGTCTIDGYAGSGGAVTIPGIINGLTVTSLAYEAFQNNTTLTSVAISDSVTSIGNDALYNCTGLTNITIPDSVTNIGVGAFASCTALTSVTIPNNVTSIADDTFFDCTSLTSVTIGNSVGYIGVDAFWMCTSLPSITIPASIYFIDEYAFQQCNSLTSVYFLGNSPSAYYLNAFADYLLPPAYVDPATVYYLPGKYLFGPTFCGLPTVVWNPQVQTNDGSFGVQNNQFGFNITGSSNLVIVVEACANLANPVWSPVGTNTLIGGSSYFSDPQWTNYSSRFYRLSSP